MKKITMYKDTKNSYRSYSQAKTFLEKHNVEFKERSLAKSAIPEEKLIKFLYFFTMCNPNEKLVVTEEDWRKLLQNKWIEKVMELSEDRRLDFVLKNYQEKLMFVGPLIFIDYYNKEGNLIEELEGTGTIGYEEDEFGIYITKAERAQQINELIGKLNENDAEFNKKMVEDNVEENEFIEVNNTEIREILNTGKQDIEQEDFKKEAIRIWEFEQQGQEYQMLLAI